MYQRVIGIVFRKVNIGFLCNSNLKYGATLRVQKIVTTLSTTYNPYWRAMRQLVYKFHGYQFITCKSESFISFKFDLVPFQPAVWGGFCIAIVSVFISLGLYQKLKNVKHFSPWWFILSNIFDEATHIPGRLEKQEFFRIVVSGWILMVVILTNCYSGLMITDLNSPLLGTNVQTTFQDLMCKDKQTVEFYREGANLTDWILTHIDGWMPSETKNILLTPVTRYYQNVYLIFACLSIYVSYLLGVRYELVSIRSSLFYEPRNLMDLVSLDTITSVLFEKCSHKYFPENFNDSSGQSG